jgi:hypothetical protein
LQKLISDIEFAFVTSASDITTNNEPGVLPIADQARIECLEILQGSGVVAQDPVKPGDLREKLRGRS